jgi:hypothetical protein
MKKYGQHIQSINKAEQQQDQMVFELYYIRCMEKVNGRFTDGR